jgi:hypothetical protein
MPKDHIQLVRHIARGYAKQLGSVLLDHPGLTHGLGNKAALGSLECRLPFPPFALDGLENIQGWEGQLPH